MKLKHILILQNKIDLVKESQAKEQYEQILAFVQGELPREKLVHQLKQSSGAHLPWQHFYNLRAAFILHLY